MALDLFADDVRRDPYPYYAWLRTESPVHWNNRLQSWIVMRYSDALTLLTHPAVRHWGGDGDATITSSSSNRFEVAIRRWFHLMDPRQGSHLRNLVAAVFAPDIVEEIRSRLEVKAKVLLDNVIQDHCFDVVNDFAAPFTLTAAARLIGVPERDHHHFQQVAHDCRHLFGVLTGSEQLTSASVEHIATFGEFMSAVFREKSTRPGRDLVTAILRAHEAGDDLDEEDYLPFLALFLFASHENVMNFIGNSICALVQHTEQLQLLQRSPALLRSGVDELLRYDSPVQFLMIRLREAVHVSDTRLPANAPVLVCVGSANRDPSRFPEPDRLDLSRRLSGHLSFGHGPLTCIGASLARLEGQIAIASIARHMTRPALGCALTWRRNPPILRGLESLVLRVGD